MIFLSKFEVILESLLVVENLEFSSSSSSPFDSVYLDIIVLQQSFFLLLYFARLFGHKIFLSFFYEIIFSWLKKLQDKKKIIKSMNGIVSKIAHDQYSCLVSSFFSLYFPFLF